MHNRSPAASPGNWTKSVMRWGPERAIVSLAPEAGPLSRSGARDQLGKKFQVCGPIYRKLHNVVGHSVTNQRILTVVFWVASATAQTIIPGGVPAGDTDLGTAVKRRLNQASPPASPKTSPSRDVPRPAATVSSPKARNVIRGHSKQGLGNPAPIADAEVTADSAPLYRGTSAQGTPVAVLKKGDRVWIDFEFKKAQTSWCSVKQKREGNAIGYLNCTDLRRTPKQF